MGIIRGTLVTLLTIVLFLSLLSSAVLLTMTLSLSYDTAQPEVAEVVADIIANETSIGDQIDEDLQGMQIYCMNHTDIVREYADHVLTIPCDTVLNGSEEIIDHAVEEIVEDNYYSEFDCIGSECITDYEPLFLFSERSREYWKGWFYSALTLSLILMALILVVMEERDSFPFLVGIVSLVVSLPFLGFGKLLRFVAGADYFKFLEIF